MLWMPDTNVWINIIKRPGGYEEAGLLRHTRAEICTYTILVAELWHGARKRNHIEQLQWSLTPLTATGPDPHIRAV